MEAKQPVRRIGDFLAQYPNENTRGAYGSSIYLYLAFIYNFKKEKKVTPKLSEKYELLASRYFSEDRKYSQDMILFAAQLADKPPKTVKSYVSTIREWLIWNDVELTQKDLRSLKNKVPHGGAATVEKDFDIEDIKSLLNHGSLWFRALILLLASSGLRIQEVLQLRLDDIDLSQEIGYLTVRAEISKTRQQRYTFCSKEAKRVLEEWLKVRDSYLKGTLQKGKALGISKDPDDPRLFPISDTTVSTAWENALKAAGMHTRDPYTNRLQVHPHMLRKFFSSQLRIAVPVDIVEGLLGHTGYLSDAYRRYTKKQVTEFYLKGEPYVNVAIPEEVREFQTRYDEKMQAHTELIETLVKESLGYKREIAELKSQVKVLVDLATKPD